MFSFRVYIIMTLKSFTRKSFASSKNRVFDALNHSEPDRIPFDLGETRISGIHEAAYRRYREKLGLPQKPVRLQVKYLQLPEIDEDFRKLLEVDIESVDPDTTPFESDTRKHQEGYVYTDMWGSEWLMPYGGHYFDLHTFPLASAERVGDVEKYPWPSGADDRLFQYMEEEAAAIAHERQRAVFVGRTSPGIFEMVQILRGHEKAFIDFALNCPIVEAVMDRILEHKLAFYRRVIDIMNDAGVDYYIICESDDLGGQDGLLISPAMYRELIKPRHKELFSTIKKESAGRAFIELHCCGAIKEIFPDLIESGVEIINPVQVSAAGMDTAVLKKEFGKEIVFHGGGVDSQYTLPYGTPGEVRYEVKRRIDDLAPGGGFIFTPVHSLQHDVPFENFLAMVETFREYVF